MTSLADRTIAALRAEHDLVATTVRDLTEEQLTGPSGAAEWTMAAVLSHLGSGAVITLAGLQSALGTRQPPEAGFNESVWDTWNAMSPAEQRAGFLEHDDELVAAFEGLDEQQRESLELRVGFLPTPLSVAAFGGMRLHEVGAAFVGRPRGRRARCRSVARIGERPRRAVRRRARVLARLHRKG